MSTHLNSDGKFQSDKYPTCPPGKVPLSTGDPAAQDLLWQYAQRRRMIDPEFSDDLEVALRSAGYVPPVAVKQATATPVTPEERDAIAMCLCALEDSGEDDEVVWHAAITRLLAENEALLAERPIGWKASTPVALDTLPLRFWRIEDGETHHFVQPTLEAVMTYAAGSLCDEDTPHVEITITELSKEQAEKVVYRDEDQDGTARTLADSPIGTYISTVF